MSKAKQRRNKRAKKAKKQGLKLTLVNTPLQEKKFLDVLPTLVEDGKPIGYDVETVAPNLRNRRSDFGRILDASLIGFSVGTTTGRGWYIPVSHPKSNCSYDTIYKTLDHVAEWASQGLVWAHNAEYEHQVMQLFGRPLPGLRCSKVAAWLVTGKHTGIGLKQLAKEILGRHSPEYIRDMAMRPAAEVLQYAGHDAVNTVELGEYFLERMSDGMRAWFETECKFGHLLAQIKAHGIGLDIDGLRKVEAMLQEDLETILEQWRKEVPNVSITSTKDLQQLFANGQWYTKTKTAGGAYSVTASTMNEQIAEGTPGAHLAELRLEFQKKAKLRGTYTNGLIEEALQWPDRRLHPDLHHTGTVTGRLSSSNPNIQNQPSHGELAKAIKACYIPSPGCMFTSADYSQVELRYFADQCGGPLLEAFTQGKDLHQMTADALNIERALGKTINFGFLLYGGGPRKMADLLQCSMGQATNAIKRLNDKYPEIEAWRAYVLEEVRKRPAVVPYVDTVAGRRRYIPELKAEEYLAGMTLVEQRKLWKDFTAKYNLGEYDRGKLVKMLESRGARLVVNTIVQGSCRDLLVAAMVRYWEKAPEGFSLVTTVHDEVLTEHPIGMEEKGQGLLQWAMESVGPNFGLTVPLVAEPTSGMKWSELK